MRRYVALLALQIGLAVSLTYENQWILAPLALLPVILLDWRILRVLLRWKLLLFLGLVVGGVPVFLGTKTASFLGVPYAPEYVRISVVMVDRCVIILLALKLFTSRLSLDELARRVRNTRFRQFGEAFALAMELLPQVRTTARQTYNEYRLTMPRRKVIRHTVSWTIELITRVLVYAENHQYQQECGEYDEPHDCQPSTRPVSHLVGSAASDPGADRTGDRYDRIGTEVHAE